jgi:hypothetical protein
MEHGGDDCDGSMHDDVGGDGAKISGEVGGGASCTVMNPRRGGDTARRW